MARGEGLGQHSAFSQGSLRKSNYTHFLWKEKEEWVPFLVPGLLPAHKSVVVKQGSCCYWARCIGANLVPTTGILPHPQPFREAPPPPLPRTQHRGSKHVVLGGSLLLATI